jgi:DNA-binding NtrC family response regulator
MDGKITALLLHHQSSPPQALTTTLKEQSIEAFTARSCGEAAGLLWDNNPPHLVFTDVQLPDGNWSDVLKLAGEAPTPVNVIVVSPVVDVTFCVEAMEWGAFDFLAPPFALLQVAHVVEAAAINILRRRGEYPRKEYSLS